MGWIVNEIKSVDSVQSVCFLPDGTLIASGSDENSMRMVGIHNAQDAEHAKFFGFMGTIEPLLDIDIYGLDFSLAAIKSEHDLEVLRQNGVKTSPTS